MRLAPLLALLFAACTAPPRALDPPPSSGAPASPADRAFEPPAARRIPPKRPWEITDIDGAVHHREAEERIDALADTYPELVGVHTIGRSVEGRPLRVMRVSSASGPRPELVLAAGIHGMEYSEKDALFMTETLLAQRDQPEVRRLLETTALWVLPMISPDGVVLHTRLNANRVDLNRNFAGTWRPEGLPGDYYHSGTEPFSEPESQALRDFLRSRERLTMYADIHRSAWLILVPPIGGGPEREIAPAVAEAARALDDAMGNLHVTKLPFRIPDQGGFTVDWVDEEFGIPAYTFEFAPERLDPTPPPAEDPRYLALLHLLGRCAEER